MRVFKSSVLSICAAIVVNLQLTKSATASEPELLKAETATADTQSGSSATGEDEVMDKSAVTAGDRSEPLPAKTLQGLVRMHQVAAGANDACILQNAHDDQSDSQTTALRELASKKLAARVELTSDEYRSLDAGCSGYESYRTFFQPVARVTVVYAGSPAEKAGLKRGDKIIVHDDDSMAKDDPTIPLEAVTCGQAGTPVHITALRKGHEVEVTMIRMNIEDIKEKKYRERWEQVIRDLGYPKGGTYIGRSLKSLKAVLDQ